MPGEVRNPQTAIQLLEVLAKFAERYSRKATLGSRNSNNVEGRGWDERRMSNVGGSKIILDFDRKSLAIQDSQVEDIKIDDGNSRVDLSETKLTVVANVLDNTTESIIGEKVNCAIIRDLVLSSRDQLIEEQKTDPELGHIYRYLENPEDSSVNAAICRKLITPFQKLVMVSDGTEFEVGDIERLFEEARRNTETKQEKWKKYYNRRRRDMQIKYRVLDTKNDNVVIRKTGKRLTINVDQVRKYRQGKCDETEIGTGSSDNDSLHDESSGFDRLQRRSNDFRDGKKKGSEVKRELEEKGLSFRNNQRVSE
ncbi:uncharacterized protein TNCV_4737641 [Trichonephila clavipes]|nr:uncharacterized protein TNCV_4737641 [Trichonephila clavipes]